MTGLGVTRLAIIGFVITALEPDVAQLVPTQARIALFWDVGPYLAVTALLVLIAVRVRQHRIAQQRDKDWRARRDLRSRGA
jgi:hypothetical protein